MILYEKFPQAVLSILLEQTMANAYSHMKEKIVMYILSPVYEI